MTEQQDHIEQFQDGQTSRSELAYAGINTFLKAEQRRIQDLADEDAAVLGAPYDSAVSNRPGARYGPEAIRRASGWWAYLSGYKGGLTNMQTGEEANFGDLSVADCGDVPVFPMNREQTAELSGLRRPEMWHNSPSRLSASTPEDSSARGKRASLLR